ncbi:hypothetical protein BN946_scf184805.g50 [Trametes cinnabarina]|uniref:Uncharacterized protein n=1 Tax=Pycnoporus cinnabarinus TaxID=5643 RepID=A0A060S3X0_PYCCI|nr:hypothetical protein BN946_scf184805.g50 [Trametes cinnabarina]
MYGIHALVKSMFAGQGLTHVAASAAPTPTGGVIPTAPGPGDVFREGGACTFSWTPDPSGVWKHTDVELMTGDNLNMVFLTTVVTFDGTDPSLTTFSYPCPDCYMQVEPNSAIYFYQFSSDAAPGALMWTARFAIADAQGKVTPPPNATQPDGQKIPWGTGALADPAKAVPEPAGEFQKLVQHSDPRELKNIFGLRDGYNQHVVIELERGIVARGYSYQNRQCWTDHADRRFRGWRKRERQR